VQSQPLILNAYIRDYEIWYANYKHYTTFLRQKLHYIQRGEDLSVRTFAKFNKDEINVGIYNKTVKDIFQTSSIIVTFYNIYNGRGQ
jgi:hypothetical protein